MEKIVSHDIIVHAIELLIEKTVQTSYKSDTSKDVKIPPRKFGYNDRNISNCLRIQGKKEDVNKSKNENSLAAQKELNKIFEELEVKAEIVNLNRLGSFENFKSSPKRPSKILGMLDLFLLEQKSKEMICGKAVYTFVAH